MRMLSNILFYEEKLKLQMKFIWLIHELVPEYFTNGSTLFEIFVY